MRRWWYLAALCAACSAEARVRTPEVPDDRPKQTSAAPDADVAPEDAAVDVRRAPDSAPVSAPDAAAADAVLADDVAVGGDGAPVGFGPPDGGTWEGQLIVAVGYDGQRMVSQNGKIWMGAMRDGTGNKEGPKALRAVAYANRQVVAVGGGCAPACAGRIVTFDGVTWTEMKVPAGVGMLTGVTYGNGVWVAVGTAPPIVRSTDNGRTWIAASSAVPAGLRAVAYGDVGQRAMFVAVGDGYARVTSTDGNTWTNLQPGDGSMDGYRAVAIGGGVVVASGGSLDGGYTESGRRIRSLDGVIWTDEVVAGPELPNLVFADGKFMAFSGSGDDTLYVSPDGQTWTEETTVGAGSNVATGKLSTQRFFISRISPATVKISVDGYVWGPTAAMSQPGDAILTAFVIAGEAP
jgi:photosystem II stability/assembly factor-like uncharacterized protein